MKPPAEATIYSDQTMFVWHYNTNMFTTRILLLWMIFIFNLMHTFEFSRGERDKDDWLACELKSLTISDFGTSWTQTYISFLRRFFKKLRNDNNTMREISRVLIGFLKNN